MATCLLSTSAHDWGEYFFVYFIFPATISLKCKLLLIFHFQAEWCRFSYFFFLLSFLFEKKPTSYWILFSRAMRVNFSRFSFPFFFFSFFLVCYSFNFCSCAFSCFIYFASFTDDGISADQFKRNEHKK